MRKKGYWRLEGGTIQTEGNRAEGGRDDASRTSLPTRRVFLVFDGRLRRVSYLTRVDSKRNRQREREKERTTGGKRRRREGRKEKKRRRRGRSTLEALRALLCPWKGVRKRDITRTLFHLFHPPTRFPRFCQPPPSIRLHLAAFGETEPTPRITELSSRASRPRDATHFPLRSCVTLSWRRGLVDNLCDPSRAENERSISFQIFFFIHAESISLLFFFLSPYLAKGKGILPIWYPYHARPFTTRTTSGTAPESRTPFN